MMSVDPPGRDVDSDDDSLRRTNDALEGREGASPSPPIPPTETLRDAPTRAPQRIGHYHVKRVLASGGMGTVYEATQEKPRRVVAVKLMRQGIASRSAMRRFEYESQILARLRHPGIAQVYEAGTHRDPGAPGAPVPFFAMEYIVGAEPITKYAKEKKLGTRERMTLFAQVCDAIHHGHQKGIIHRDLKPSNILVDATGQVKIIDFGVARSTDSDLAVTTLQTDIGQLIGTLQYMSPEQCKADPHDIDTRSDVYALGVVFYELLCGRLPYNVTRVAMHEATRIIREEQPTKLSTLNKTLRGDVETIALKALEKDRERRYQSATDFAQDIRRYLNNEAITARPPSVLYQFRVLVRRNRPVFGAIAAVFVVLLGGVIVSTSMYVRSEANRIRAEHEATKAHATLDILKDVFAPADPFGGHGPDVTLRSMLHRLAEKVEVGEVAENPEVEASVRSIIAKAYVSLTLYDAAKPHVANALAIHRRVLGNDHPDTLLSAYQRARLLGYLGKYQEAEPLIRETFEAQRRILGSEHPDTLTSMRRLATVLREQGKLSEAEKLERQVLPLYRRVYGDEDRATLMTMNNLGVTLWVQGKLREAEELFREAMQTGRRVLGEENPSTFMPMENLGWVLLRRGKLEEAEGLCQRALELNLAILGEKGKSTFEAMNCVASVLRAQGRLTEAEELFRRVLELRREVMGPQNPQTHNSLNNLAKVLVSQGKMDEARPYVAELIGHRKRAAERSDASVNDLNNYAMLVLTCEPEDLRDPQAALPVAKRAVEMTGSKDLNILDTLALAYFMTGDAPKAIETQEKAIEQLPQDDRAEYEAALAKYRAALDNGE